MRLTLRRISKETRLVSSCSTTDSAPATLVGDGSEWFDILPEGDAVVIQPREPLPRRCVLKPMALFRDGRGFPEICTAMGRLHFVRGHSDPVTYRPFTLDANRHLEAMFFPIESMPDDELPASAARWRNWATIARRLCDEAELRWSGLPDDQIEVLVRYVPWHGPVEGCLLHALVEHYHPRGDCVMEIGSLRGNSAFLMSLALEASGSESALVSIDPHIEQPWNAEHVRIALRQLGQERRLVQIPLISDSAWKLLRPESAGLIFVDGDHSAVQVAREIDRYADLLAPGGCLVFHDYGFGLHNGQPEAHPGVRQAVDAELMNSDTFRPIALAHMTMAFEKAS